MPVMIPSPAGATVRGDVSLHDYAQWLGGPLLEGGADLWPGSYGETQLQDKWSGDRIRDDYQQALLKESHRPDQGTIDDSCILEDFLDAARDARASIRNTPATA